MDIFWMNFDHQSGNFTERLFTTILEPGTGYVHANRSPVVRLLGS